MRKGSHVIMGCMAILSMTMLAGASTAGAVTNASASAPQLQTITIPAPAGEIPSKWLNYPGPARANVLLPAGYNPNTQYPLLVLLNGLGGNYDSFDQFGLLPELNSLNAIVVMPDGGPGGWYADWANGGPAWETYELDTVLPAIMSKYPILPQRQFHAIAGISMGGLGAAYLGGRLPGFFGSVASLSGFVDPQLLAPIVQPFMGIVSGASENGDKNLNPVYGPPLGFYANGHNPTNLAMNLQHTRVFESTGTSIPNPGNLGLLSYGTAGAEELFDGTWEESIIFAMNVLYHQALTAAGVDVTYQVHSGGHDIPDFVNEVNAFVAWGPFKSVTPDPSSWTNDTVATSGYLWDIAYHFTQAPDEVVKFQQSGNSLSISGAGSDVTITTVGGCVIHSSTPATISVPTKSCS